MAKIAPSILAADFSQLAAEMERVADADWLHIDVMDGSFVPNISMGPPVIASLRRRSRLFFDVHLMVDAPERFLKAFADAGADRITVHQEACRHLHSTLLEIGRLGKKAGVALNPATPVETIAHVVHLVDLILIMTVNPGFGGQKFLPETLPKMTQVSELIKARGLDVEIEVDGGIDGSTAPDAVRSGATALVAGSALFGAQDPAEALRRLRASIAP